ncbi:MAG: 4Fe-4S binding protein [Desulfatiglans sp.]|jgi:pyruvate ferredoxin oxidoreductase delta subunit|nr:4Fe-4S binding protein [Desulfatiglans sp.]
MKFKLKYEGPWAEIEKTLDMPTGNWRYSRPVIKFPKCCQCGWCYLYCPTGSIAITEHERFTIDLTYCKGCGICASVCPVDAIMMVEEV